MSKLRQHVEDMRTSVTQTASNEQSLVKSLGDALNHVDQQLLRDIRKVAAEHEARRAVIFNELQALAHTIGAFPTAHEIPHVPPANDANPQFAVAVGDWRQATRNLSYQDEFEQHLNVNPNGTIGGNGTGRH